jgi:hypothetical protein
MAGHPTVYIGTWESHVAPEREASNKPRKGKAEVWRHGSRTNS